MKSGAEYLLHFRACFMALCCVLTETAKQRTWRGPTHFFDGSAPSSRYGHGFCLAGGNLYVFGGSGNGGGAKSNQISHFLFGP